MIHERRATQAHGAIVGVAFATDSSLVCLERKSYHSFSMDDDCLLLESIAALPAGTLPRFCVARYGTSDFEGLSSYLRSPSGVSASSRCIHAPSAESPGIIAHGREVRIYSREGHAVRVDRLRDGIAGAAYATGTRRLVTVLVTGAVWVWDVEGGGRRELEGVAGSACVAVSPDGTACATAAGSTVTIHALQSLTKIRELSGMRETIGSLHFADGGRVVVAGGSTSFFLHDDDDSDVVAWDVATGAMLWHRVIGGGDTSSLWIGDDGLRVAGGGLKDVSFVLDARTGESVTGEGLKPPADLLPVARVPGACPVRSLDVSGDGRWIATDEVLWNVARRSSRPFPGSDLMTDGVGFSAGSDAVMRLFLDGVIECRSLPSLEARSRSHYAPGVWRDFLVPGGDWVVAVFQDFGAAGGPDKNRIELFSAADLAHVRRIEHPLVELSGVTPGCDGDVLVGTAGGRAIVWDLPDGIRRSVCEVRGGCLAVGPGGESIVVSPPLEPRVEIVDTSTGHVVERIETDGIAPVTAAFSPGGTVLAIACADWTVRLHPVGRGRAALLAGHLGEVTRLVFSRDGRTLYTGSRDFTVYGWDVARATAA